jgi:hypothetical protein
VIPDTHGNPVSSCDQPQPIDFVEGARNAVPPLSAYAYEKAVSLLPAMKVTADGIEQQAAADRLGQFGCDVGQGYLFAKP